MGRRLPKSLPFDTIHHVDEAVAEFDKAFFLAMDVSSWMKPNLTPDYHQIPENVRLSALQKSELQRR